jgi:peroxidase
LIRQPFQLYEPGVLDEYYIGMINQPALAFDNFITAEVTAMLFRKPGERHGADLTAFNIQCNREVGLPGYTESRKYCGLSPVNT